MLQKEASEGSHEEFVVGRLLNIYEPIINAGFLRSVELAYKKRVIAEALIKIQSNYLDFSPNLIIPYEYFLFDRLHQRALAYPLTIYSFANAYTCRKSKENLETALRGFREAGNFLVSNGIMESSDGSVRLFRGKKRAVALAKLLRMFPQTTVGAVAYVAAGVSSKVGLVVPKTEVLSKLGESRAAVESPVELDRPKSLLRLAQGVIFDDTSKTVEEIARISGFKGKYSFKRMKKGDAINASEELEIWAKGMRAKFILKRFPEIKSVKWVLLNLWGFTAKRFNMSPIARLQREYEGALRMRELGISTHRIIGVALDERTLVTKYVEGAALSDSVDEVTRGKSVDVDNVEKYGLVLATLHKAGMVYGDTKAQNVLVAKDVIELVDLEQAVENGDPSWDLAEFLYYAAKSAQKEEGMKLVAEAFLRGYLNEGSKQVVAKAGSARYLAPFIPFLASNMISMIRNTLRGYGVASPADSHKAE